MGRLQRGDTLLLATHNAGKLTEFTELFAPFDVKVVGAKAFGLPEPAETGWMFAQNAAIKALAAARATGLPALADDSGLCVDALDGAPGLFTADWAGKPADFSAAMAKVADELHLRGVPPHGAAAHFTAALVLAQPDGTILLAEGRVFGTFAYPPRGEAGFGYDPAFCPQGQDRTFGEMTAQEKHGIALHNGQMHGVSHRARAFIKLLEKLNFS